MSDFLFEQILRKVTVMSKDDGRRFLVFDRIEAIREILAKTDYKLQHEGDLCLIYSKKPIEDQSVTLISSHIDCVYHNCFCEEEEECYKGTFDNSLTNAAVLYNMLHDRFDENVVIAFTGDEEKDSAGCWEVMRTLKNANCFVKSAVVTEVTNEGWEENCAFTLENDLGIDLITAHRLIESLKCREWDYMLVHEAEPDESWDLDTAGIPCLTLCSPILGDMHSDDGVLARKCHFHNYLDALAILTHVFATAD